MGTARPRDSKRNWFDMPYDERETLRKGKAMIEKGKVDYHFWKALESQGITEYFGENVIERKQSSLRYALTGVRAVYHRNYAILSFKG